MGNPGYLKKNEHGRKRRLDGGDSSKSKSLSLGTVQLMNKACAGLEVF
jgi:hypothetical protein